MSFIKYCPIDSIPGGRRFSSIEKLISEGTSLTEIDSCIALQVRNGDKYPLPAPRDIFISSYVDITSSKKVSLISTCDCISLPHERRWPKGSICGAHIIRTLPHPSMLSRTGRIIYSSKGWAVSGILLRFKEDKLPISRFQGEEKGTSYIEEIGKTISLIHKKR